MNAAAGDAERTGRTAARWRAALLVLAAWLVVGLIRAADRYFSDPFQVPRLEFGLWEALTQNLLWALIWATLTPFVVAVVRRSLPPRRVTARSVLALTGAALALPIVHCAAFQLVYPLLMGFPCVPAVQLRAVPALLPVLFPTHVVTFAAIGAVAGMLGCSALARERALRASQLKTRLASARLEALKVQLHPHFLFNALNSILPLVFRDADAATRTVARLAELLRLTLENEGSDLLPLRRELQVLSVYLEIQQTRFQDRLSVRLDVDPDTADALVPNLILQPLVENAIKHGIAAKPGAGRIEIEAHRRADGRLRLVVRDDGPGPPPRARREGGEGVGLRNTRDRLELLYAEDHAFSFQGSPGRGCEVELTIPLSFERAPADAKSEAREPAGLAGTRAQWVPS